MKYLYCGTFTQISTLVFQSLSLYVFIHRHHFPHLDQSTFVQKYTIQYHEYTILYPLDDFPYIIITIIISGQTIKHIYDSIFDYGYTIPYYNYKLVLDIFGFELILTYKSLVINGHDSLQLYQFAVIVVHVKLQGG